MSNNLCKCIDLLEKISKIKNPNLRKEVLAEFSSDESLFLALCEILFNLKKIYPKLEKRQQIKIKRYTRSIKNIVGQTKPKTVRQRKKVAKQIGGFLPILIPTVISILSALLKS